jgi:DNA processing protein
MSDAVLVIEATEKSGTLITARQALELGRDIGAVPGDIFSDSSCGTNMLIKEGAYMIRNSDDLYDLLHIARAHVEAVQMEFSEEEAILLAHLAEPHGKRYIISASELSPQQFLMALSSLEMKGCVQETFGEVRKVV